MEAAEADGMVEHGVDWAVGYIEGWCRTMWASDEAHIVEITASHTNRCGTTYHARVLRVLRGFRHGAQGGIVIVDGGRPCASPKDAAFSLLRVGASSCGR